MGEKWRRFIFTKSGPWTPSSTRSGRPWASTIFKWIRSGPRRCPAGLGWVRSQHGPLPLPAPATLALLEGAALVPSGLEKELVTPTGAAIVKTWVRHFGPPPACTLTKAGYGLGRQELSDRPNALRIWLGEGIAPGEQDKVTVLETNIDDMNPQWYDYLFDRLFQAGALDCLLLPCQMKKNRPVYAASPLPTGRPGASHGNTAG